MNVNNALQLTRVHSRKSIGSEDDCTWALLLVCNNINKAPLGERSLVSVFSHRNVLAALETWATDHDKEYGLKSQHFFRKL